MNGANHSIHVFLKKATRNRCLSIKLHFVFYYESKSYLFNNSTTCLPLVVSSQIKVPFIQWFQDLASELRSGLGEDWGCLINALLKGKATGSASLLHDALEVHYMSVHFIQDKFHVELH